MSYDALFDSDENKTLLAICARKLIRNIGIGGIIWGSINIVIGAVAMGVTMINAGLVLLGAGMLAAGIQALRRPTLRALLTETIVSIVLFFWNLGIAVYNGMGADAIEPRGIIIPLIIAITFYRNYRRLLHVEERIATIEPQRVEKAKQICKAIVAKKLKEEPSIVQTANRRCRAQLLDGRAFFIQRDLMRAFVASRDDVRAAIAKPEAKRYKTTFNHPLGKLAYTFNKNETGKIKAWLAQPSTADHTASAWDMPGQP